MGAMPNKTDRNDARGLAQIVRTGWYRAVHVKSPACRSWRALLAARRLVLNKMRDVENGLRALLREAGLKLGRPGRKEFAARARELTADDSVLSAVAEPLLAVVEVMTRELARLTRQILAVVRDEPVCRRLMGVPGVGPLTALAFRATIDRPDRFRRSRDVGAHLGLTPKRYQSGETDVQGGISRCGDELARTALYEAAHSLLVRSRRWSSLRAWGIQVAKRRGMARARIAVARKLAVVLHRVWADGTEFRWGKEDAAPAAWGRSSCRRAGRSRVVPVGTTGEAIPLRASSRGATAPEVATQIGTPPPGPRDAAAPAPTAERSERPTGAAGTKSGLT